MQNSISAIGIGAMLALAWILSTNRKRFPWRLVGIALAMELVFGAIVFRLSLGREILLKVNDFVCSLQKPLQVGPELIFGRLAGGAQGVFVFQVFPIIIVVSALLGALYYLGVIPRVVRVFAAIFSRCLKVSGAESLCVACNIFVGVESSVAVRPHLERMTRSELHTVLTACMASVASNVMFLYILKLSGVFPQIAGHLISASLLSAPAALVFSKILLPEEDTPQTLGQAVDLHYERESSLFESIIQGANQGMRLVVGIVTLLLAIYSLVALVNAGLGWLGQNLGWDGALSLEWILEKIFYPFAILMGVPLAEAGVVARILGERPILTEVYAYEHLARAVSAGEVGERSTVICAYALCGFAHIPSMAIFVGGISALVPSRRADLARLAPRALLAATLACLLTGAVAGLFYRDGAGMLIR